MLSYVKLCSATFIFNNVQLCLATFQLRFSYVSTMFHLCSATFSYVKVHSAMFSYIQLRSNAFSYARLRSATFSYVQQRSAMFSYVQLHSATISYDQLQSAMISYDLLWSAAISYKKNALRMLWSMFLKLLWKWSCSRSGIFLNLVCSNFCFSSNSDNLLCHQLILKLHSSGSQKMVIIGAHSSPFQFETQFVQVRWFDNFSHMYETGIKAVFQSLLQILGLC